MKNRLLRHILRGESLVNEIIKRLMKGKRGRGKPRIIMLDFIEANESYEKLWRRATDRKFWRSWMPRILKGVISFRNMNEIIQNLNISYFIQSFFIQNSKN